MLSMFYKYEVTLCQASTKNTTFTNPNKAKKYIRSSVPAVTLYI